jgi:LuxR family maltose regulon positive regulatory protein
VVPLRPSLRKAARAEDTEHERDSEHTPSPIAPLRATQNRRHVAPAATSSSRDDSASAAAVRGWLIQSLLLEAILGENGGDSAAVARALQCALHLAEGDHVLSPFLVHPVAAPVDLRAQRPTARGNLIVEILDLLAGTNGSSSRHGSEALREPLTESEMRVLRYLPTDLSKQEIANELYVSVNTVKTHVKHLYAKLHARTRRQAIARARELGLLKRSLSSA